MKKILFAFALFFVGCTTEVPSSFPNHKGRFIILYEQSCFDGGTQIICDTVTGQKYLFHKCGYAGGLTKL